MSAQRQDGWDAKEVGRHQSLYREVNEQVARIEDTFGGAGRISIVCECGSSWCHERIELSRDDYERLRLVPTRFAVLPGHDIPAVERLVEENDGYVIVEKVGEGAVAAIKLDPRRRR